MVDKDLNFVQAIHADTIMTNEINDKTRKRSDELKTEFLKYIVLHSDFSETIRSSFGNDGYDIVSKSYEEFITKYIKSMGFPVKGFERLQDFEDGKTVRFYSDFLNNLIGINEKMKKYIKNRRKLIKIVIELGSRSLSEEVKRSEVEELLRNH